MKRTREPEDEDEDRTGYSQNVAIVPVSKIVTLDTEDSEAHQATNTAIQCSLPGHARGTSFPSYAEYERHYAQVHSNRCLSNGCNKNFPTSHILGLHIQEHHDALTEVKRETGEATYACFVEVCEAKFQSFQKRKQHLVHDHAFPPNYFFAVTKYGIDAKRQSMLVEHDREHNSRRKGSSRSGGRNPKGPAAAKPAAQRGDTTESRDEPMADVEAPAEEKQESAPDVAMSETPQSAGNTGATNDGAMDGVSKPAVAESSEKQQERGLAGVVDTEMEDLAGAMSSLKFVPRAIRLGAKPKPRR